MRGSKTKAPLLRRRSFVLICYSVPENQFTAELAGKLVMIAADFSGDDHIIDPVRVSALFPVILIAFQMVPVEDHNIRIITFLKDTSPGDAETLCATALRA